MSKASFSATTLLCAIYGRSSVDEEAMKEFGTNLQQEHLGREQARLLSESTGKQYVVKYVLIEDRGVSGGTTNRPKYQQLLDLIISRKIDVVIAKEVSRLSRSTRDFCDFINICKDNGVAVHIRGLNIDPSDPMSSAMFQMLAVIAELERNIIRERTRSSIRSAMKNNAKIPGGVVPLGFDRDPLKPGFWNPNYDELKIVVSLMNRFNECLSYRETLRFAKRHGLKNKKGEDFNKNSLKRIFTNQKYIGKLIVPGESDVAVDLPFGSVIPVDLFEKVGENVRNLEDLPTNMRVKKKTYLLSGLLEYEDGTAFIGKSGKGRLGDMHYYYFNEAKKFSVNAIALEKVVLKALRVFEDNKKMIEYANEIKKERFSKVDLLTQQVRRAQRELSELDQKEQSLMDKVITFKNSSESVAWLEKQLKSIANRRRDLSEEIPSLEKERSSYESKHIDGKSMRNSLKVVFDHLEASDAGVQKGILRQLFEKIRVYSDNRVELLWKIPTCDFGGTQVALGVEWGG